MRGHYLNQKVQKMYLEYPAESSELLVEFGRRILVLLQHGDGVIRCLKTVHARRDKIFVDVNL